MAWITKMGGKWLLAKPRCGLMYSIQGVLLNTPFMGSKRFQALRHFYELIV
ncbi:hypothetical protein HMPREF1207_00244 [Paenibacillus sp. HGH0039]|nr:hypothetical protein HMPREF1207_00244 [Paenibacillus sp. HGH0039]